MTSWKSGQFEITVWDDRKKATVKKKLVDGEVKGLFGIHGTPFNYTLTHIPTGYNFNRLLESGSPLEGIKCTKKNWKRFVAKIEGLKWDFVNQQGLSFVTEDSLRLAAELSKETP